MGANNIEEDGYKGYCVVSLPNQVADIEDHSSKRRASGVFEDVASCCIVITHSCLGKLTSLPFPMGDIMEAVEEAVVPIERFTLRLLTALDDQIYGIIMRIEGSITSASEKSTLVLRLVRERGVLGMSADFWVQHEVSIREWLQRTIDFVDTIPLIGVATPFVCTVSAPSMNAMSDWLVGHSQSQDKAIQFHHKMSDKMEAVYSQDLLSIRNAIKDAKEDEATKAMSAPPKDTEEGNLQAKGVKEEEIVEAKDKEVTDEQSDGSEVSAVLDMIDSGWLLGSGGAISPRAHVVAAAADPKKQASSKKKRGILRR
ncbi:hypothetical protein GOP47_0018411 [Adiantum capillus-veneris]|uniref:Uncharacterized protein n=1 Tax=Adiantum capillus-veneris TaxID=13818 RepID=A0A9D4UDQ9_ADICA|nr:hypothetical protein GOP47_0018411 [Adiantum capillus-veneris]